MEKHELAQIADEVRKLIFADDAQRLGFGLVKSRVHVYIGETPGSKSPWYTLGSDEKRTPIESDNLLGIIKAVIVKEVNSTSHGSSDKLMVFVKADKNYVIRSGVDTHFSKSLLGHLMHATKEQLAGPLGIIVRPGSENEKVSFASVVDSEGRPLHKNGDGSPLEDPIQAAKTINARIKEAAASH